MPFENWLAFAAAAAIVLVIPGPTILLVISYALGHGRKPAAAIVAGVALGDLTAMTASMVGLGAILAASAGLFTVLRWVGAAYLIYLGIKLWRASVAQKETPEAPSLGLPVSSLTPMRSRRSIQRASCSSSPSCRSSCRHRQPSCRR